MSILHLMLGLGTPGVAADVLSFSLEARVSDGQAKERLGTCKTAACGKATMD